MHLRSTGKVFMSSRVVQVEQRKTADAVGECIDRNLLLLILPSLDVPILDESHAMRGAQARVRCICQSRLDKEA